MTERLAYVEIEDGVVVHSSEALFPNGMPDDTEETLRAAVEENGRDLVVLGEEDEIPFPGSSWDGISFTAPPAVEEEPQPSNRDIMESISRLERKLPPAR